jgi:hypothetical protein
MRTAQSVLVAQPEGKKHLRDLGLDGRIFKMQFEDMRRVLYSAGSG